MFKRLFFLGLSLLSFQQILVAQIQPSNGIVEHFKFDGSLSGENGGSIGGVTPSYVQDRFGNPNKAHHFTTGTSAISIANFPTGTTSRTFSFWFKASANQFMDIFNFRGSTSGELNVTHRLADLFLAYTHIGVDNGGTASNSMIRSAMSFSPEWKHITVVNTSGVQRVYINGVFYRTETNSPNIVGNIIYRIGMSGTDVVAADFALDDMVLYNRALSDFEVVKLFKSGSNQPPVQEWSLFQAGAPSRSNASFNYLKRANTMSSNQVLFTAGHTAHGGGNPVVTANTEPRLMHENNFITSATTSNFQGYGTEYTMDANTTTTDVNSLQDEAFVCGAGWILYYNTNNTQSRSGYWVGKIYKRVAAPNSTTAFTEVHVQGGRILTSIKSNKRFGGNVVLSAGATAPTTYGNSGAGFVSKPTIVRSTDNGNTWTGIDLSSFGNGGITSTVWLNQNDVIVVGYKTAGGGGFDPETYTPLILKSTDAGLNWTDISPTDNYLEALRRIIFTNNVLWVAGDNGKLLKSTNQGASWTVVSTDCVSSIQAIQFTDAQNGWIAGIGGFTARTTDGGITWRRGFRSDLTRVTGIEFKDANNGLLQTINGNLYSFTPCVPTGSTLTVTSCGPYTSPSGQQTWTSTGQYSETLSAINGCDSVVTVNLTVINNFNTTQTVSACGSYTWVNGTTYTSSTSTPTFTFQSVDGCDSIVTLNLTIYQASPATHTINTCNSYTWVDGITYTSSNNTATFLLQTVNGCDSLVTLNLTIGNNTGTAVVSACESYTWINNVTYTSSTSTPTFTLTNSAGCDSVVTLNLTIFNNQTGTAIVNACGSYTWIDGATYTSSNNTATHLLQSVNGCDSLVTLNLTIGESNTGVETIEACGSYTWINGSTYTTSTNSPTFVLTNASGCDSTVTLNLTIKNTSSGIDVISSCDPITWIDGNTYSNSTTSPTFTLTNAVGCDSVVTLNLTINALIPSISLNGSTLSTSATNGTYQWFDCDTEQEIEGANNASYTPTVSGSYAVEFTRNGCSRISDCVEVEVAGNENLDKETIQLYPNPTREQIVLVSPSRMTVTIANVTGEKLRNINIEEGKNQIQLQEFLPGVYFIETSNGDVIRFVKI